MRFARKRSNSGDVVLYQKEGDDYASPPGGHVVLPLSRFQEDRFTLTFQMPPTYAPLIRWTGPRADRARGCFCRRVRCRATDHFPLARLIAEPVAELEVRRKDASC
jgi:hypothetical protein